MKLYLLTLIDEKDLGWDEYCGFVVTAEGFGDARILAFDKSSEERWRDEDETRCTVIGEDTTGIRGVKLDSFNAG